MKRILLAACLLCGLQSFAADFPPIQPSWLTDAMAENGKKELDGIIKCLRDKDVDKTEAVKKICDICKHVKSFFTGEEKPDEHLKEISIFFAVAKMNRKDFIPIFELLVELHSQEINTSFMEMLSAFAHRIQEEGKKSNR